MDGLADGSGKIRNSSPFGFRGSGRCSLQGGDTDILCILIHTSINTHILYILINFNKHTYTFINTYIL